MDRFLKLLQATPFAKNETAVVPVLDTGFDAVVVKVDSSQADMLWCVARDLLPESNRWPVVSCLWSNDFQNWQEGIENENLFSRFYYDEENDEGTSPSELVDRSKEALIDQFQHDAKRKRNEYLDLQSDLEYELEGTKLRCGEAPSIEELISFLSSGDFDDQIGAIDNYLFKWEKSRKVVNEIDVKPFDWFYQNPMAMVFLPTSNAYETLAYQHWYGSISHGSATNIMIHKVLMEKYGAELCGHHGTMLQFNVNKPPKTDEESRELADFLDLVSPYTINSSGIRIRHYGLMLKNSDRWFLHERP